ncbi:hypothetical protein D5086_002350 [Populus alba]|uniref:Uncharacterized protein n=1 Tax=Populus alba TaxID=43335 RepID=A0ACC4D1F5_POPAL
MSRIPICLISLGEACLGPSGETAAPYYEVSPAGHCPHDEVPEVCSSSLLIISLMALSVALFVAHPIDHAVKNSR